MFKNVPKYITFLALRGSFLQGLTKFLATERENEPKTLSKQLKHLFKLEASHRHLWSALTSNLHAPERHPGRKSDARVGTTSYAKDTHLYVTHVRLKGDVADGTGRKKAHTRGSHLVRKVGKGFPRKCSWAAARGQNPFLGEMWRPVERVHNEKTAMEEHRRWGPGPVILQEAEDSVRGQIMSGSRGYGKDFSLSPTSSPKRGAFRVF